MDGIIKENGLKDIWKRIFLATKMITGDVDFENDGTLQEQINKIKQSGTVTVDSELSKESENPVQNKVITKKIENIEDSMGGLKFGVSDNGCLTVTYDDGTTE